MTPTPAFSSETPSLPADRNPGTATPNSPVGGVISGLLFLALVGLLGFMIYESWSSPVEDALEARLRESTGLAVHVEQVQCGAATGGSTRCEVAYVAGTGLAAVALSLPASALPFPAAFTVDRERRAEALPRVRTPYDGKAMAFEAGARALQASVNVVTRAADKTLGPQLQQGLNALTYERAAEALGRDTLVAVDPPGTAAAAAPAPAADTVATAAAGDVPVEYLHSSTQED